jgi:hypothetical protein
MVLVLRVRRLFCAAAACQRRTFAEQVEGLTVPYGRRTPVLRQMLEQVAVALAGRAGARLARVLQAPTSRSTLLRLLMSVPDPEHTDQLGKAIAECAQRRAVSPPDAQERRSSHAGLSWGGGLTAPPRRPTQRDAASHTNPSGSVKGPASLPIMSRCDPVPSAATPATLARAGRL